MAVIQYKGFNTTVATIADRNAIANKVDHMVVIVQDAIADTAAGTGKATYRWDATDSTWILISKSTSSTLSITTEELTITNGSVTASNYIADTIWDIAVVDGDVVIAHPRVEDLTISLGNVSGLTDYEGYELRFTYAYGSISTQLGSAMDVIVSAIEAINTRIDQLESNTSTTAVDSITEIADELENLGNDFQDFLDTYNAANS